MIRNDDHRMEGWEGDGRGTCPSLGQRAKEAMALGQGKRLQNQIDMNANTNSST